MRVVIRYMYDLADISCVHMIGIGGIGMSALAHALHDRGVRVTGSDVIESDQVQRLRALGITVHLGHNAANVDGAQLVTHTSAIRRDNCEWEAAAQLGIPVIHRSELLAAFLQGKRAVAVAGTHGKTTTTAMLTTILIDAGMDPTVFLGGISLDLGDNYRLGGSDLVVFEADESDASFRRYRNCWQIVTNVDQDHLDKHANLDNIKQMFAEFMSTGNPEGFLVYGSDIEGLSDMAQCFPGPTRSFGIDDPNAYYRADEIRCTEDFRCLAQIHVGGRRAGTLSLQQPGHHNICNALAAVGMAHSMGVAVEEAVQSLERFTGTERRFQLLYHRDGLRIYDDYAHHPTEVKAALRGARDLLPNARLTVVFQPHLPSRTRLLLDDFATAFGLADTVIINSIYAAREEPIPGFSAETLVERIRSVDADKPVLYFENQDELLEHVWANLADQELVMVMGAGDIYRVGHTIANRLAQEDG